MSYQQSVRKARAERHKKPIYIIGQKKIPRKHPKELIPLGDQSFQIQEHAKKEKKGGKQKFPRISEKGVKGASEKQNSAKIACFPERGSALEKRNSKIRGFKFQRLVIKRRKIRIVRLYKGGREQRQKTERG